MRHAIVFVRAGPGLPRPSGAKTAVAQDLACSWVHKYCSIDHTTPVLVESVGVQLLRRPYVVSSSSSLEDGPFRNSPLGVHLRRYLPLCFYRFINGWMLHRSDLI